MNYAGIYMIVKMVYKTILRPLLVKAIADPEEVWDDFVLKIVDRVFDYSE